TSTRASSPKVHRIHPAFPHAMVLTAYFVLSPATNSSCHRHRRIKACLRPVGPTCLHQLDTSNGCQDHTALPSASASFVSTPFDRSRIFRPALPSRHAPDAAASTASRPASVTIASRPSVGRDGGDIVLIWVKQERKYFCKQDWTAGISLIRFNKSLPRE